MNSVLYRLGVVLIVLCMAPSGLGGGGSGTQVFFSPAPLTQESIRDEIIKRINLSVKSIDIAIYNFTAGTIAQALLDAKKRGVRIRIILDKMQINKRGTKGRSEYGFLVDNGFNPKVLGGIERSGIMHNKIAIYDGLVVQTGSYNWSDNAEDNSWENAVFIDDASVVQKCRDYFQRMWNYGGR